MFLKFADNNYARAEQAINDEFAKLTGTRREKPIDEIAIEKCGFIAISALYQGSIL